MSKIDQELIQPNGI